MDDDSNRQKDLVATGKTRPVPTTNTADQEFFKSFYEYLRHLSALATGAIVLTAAFMEKLFIKPSWRPMVVLSVGAFLFCVLSSVTSYTLVVMNHPGRMVEATELERRLIAVTLVLTWLSFLIGVSALAIFILRNLAA